jgi:hypothetical protein
MAHRTPICGFAALLLVPASGVSGVFLAVVQGGSFKAIESLDSRSG